MTLLAVLCGCIGSAFITGVIAHARGHAAGYDAGHNRGFFEGQRAGATGRWWKSTHPTTLSPGGERR